MRSRRRILWITPIQEMMSNVNIEKTTQNPINLLLMGFSHDFPIKGFFALFSVIDILHPIHSQFTEIKIIDICKLTYVNFYYIVISDGEPGVKIPGCPPK